MRRFVLVVLVLAGMLLASCGPAMMPAAAPQTESGETFVVALPRIVITFDEQGNPGVEGVALEEIARSLGVPLDLGQYRIDPFYPAWMKAANIQHIELRQTGDGIALLVNGALMPSLSFQDGSLQRMSDIAPLLGQNGPAIGQLMEKFAPLVQRLGLSDRVEVPGAGRGAADRLRAGGHQGGRARQPSAEPPVSRRQVRAQVRRPGRALDPGHLGPRPAGAGHQRERRARSERARAAAGQQRPAHPAQQPVQRALHVRQRQPAAGHRLGQRGAEQRRAGLRADEPGRAEAVPGPDQDLRADAWPDRHVWSWSTSRLRPAPQEIPAKMQ